MSKRIIAILFLMCFFVISARSQQKNKIELAFGPYMLGYKYESTNKLEYYDNTISIAYSRTLKGKLNISARAMINDHLYSRNLIEGKLWTNEYAPRRLFGQHFHIDGKGNEIGRVFTRGNYSFWDLGLQYELLYKNKQSITISQYLSLAKGTDVYVIGVDTNRFDEGYYTHVDYESKNAQYLGGVTGIDYNYHLWKDRINVGAHIAARYYLGGFPIMLNFGIQAGFSF